MFYNLFEARLHMSGPQLEEAFEAADSTNSGFIRLKTLQDTLQALSQASAEEEAEDPVGMLLAAFIDGNCVLESLSLRACSVGRLELTPMSNALAKCPWQLRCLNLWDNRICDRGAALLGSALQSYRGLEHLAVGRNRITDVGLQSLCRPFQSEVLVDQAKATEAKERIQQQLANKEAATKAKAKEKPQPKTAGVRIRRDPILLVEVLQELGDSEWQLRRPCELRVLNVSDNPIEQPETVEALLPDGPDGAELVIRGTAAAAAILAQRPELALPRRSSSQQGGWTLRVM